MSDKRKLLIVNGPNLNHLGSRDTVIYGHITLADINVELTARARDLDVEVEFFQSNTEGDLINFLQSRCPTAHGIIINPGALTHYGLSLREALVDSRLPIIEVHISNILSREEWRSKSVVGPIATGQVTGLGWKGYIYALDYLSKHLIQDSDDSE